MKGLVLIGGGGHCKAAIDVIEAAGLKVFGVLERPDASFTEVLGYPVLGEDGALPALVSKGHPVIVTIGQIKTAAPRVRAFETAQAVGADMPYVISPHAYVSRHSELGSGTLVLHGAVINAAAQIGRNVIINSMALVEHDAQVGDHCHIATGAKVNGGVNIGIGVFVGSGAVLKNGITVGDGAVIAAGALVRQNIPKRALVVPSTDRSKL